MSLEDFSLKRCKLLKKEIFGDSRKKIEKTPVEVRAVFLRLKILGDTHKIMEGLVGKYLPYSRDKAIYILGIQEIGRIPNYEFSIVRR